MVQLRGCNDLNINCRNIVQVGTRPREWYEQVIAGISWLVCPKDVPFMVYVKHKPFYCLVMEDK